jgi:hypothetical protein
MELATCCAADCETQHALARSLAQKQLMELIAQHGAQEAIRIWNAKASSSGAAKAAKAKAPRGKRVGAAPKKQATLPMGRALSKAKPSTTASTTPNTGKAVKRADTVDMSAAECDSDTDQPPAKTKAQLDGGSTAGGALAKKVKLEASPADESGANGAMTSHNEEESDAGDRAMACALKLTQASALSVASAPDLSETMLAINVELAKAEKASTKTTKKPSTTSNAEVTAALRQLAGHDKLVEAAWVLLTKARWNTWGSKLRVIADAQEMTESLAKALHHVGLCMLEIAAGR